MNKTAINILQNEHKVLQPLFVKLKRLEELEQILKTHIDPKFVNHCRIASFSEGMLVLMTESALWATHIRFAVPELLKKLRHHESFQSLTQIQTKILPAKHYRLVASSSSRKASRLSTQTAEIVLEIANHIQYDKLRNIMQKIANRFRSTDTD